MVLRHRVFVCGVLPGASSTALCSKFSRFLGDFRGRQRYFQFVWFDVMGGFGPKIGFYGCAFKASWSARELYAACLVFYGQ